MSAESVTSRFDLGKCSECPGIQKCLTAIASAEALSAGVRRNFENNAYEKAVDLLMEDSALDPDFQHVPLDRDELLRTMMTDAALGLDYIEARSEAAERHLKLLRLGCSGILKMRAAKAGVEYTAEICTSPQTAHYRQGGEDVVRVKRRLL